MTAPPRLTSRRARLWALAAVLVGGLVAILLQPPMPQNPAYHAFADQRPWLGVPNFGDVASNLPFLLVGLWALARRARWVADDTRLAWGVFFAGVALVSLGSSYYHWAPSNETLVWDRLPMTVGFMALFVALLAEYLDPRLVRLALGPALLVGAASVVYWHLTDDLRPYVWVQGAPLLAVPLVMILFKPRYSHSAYLLLGLACYLLAKVTETYDAAIFSLDGGVISGHTLKHLLAAAGPLWLYTMLVRRRPRQGADPGPGVAP